MSWAEIKKAINDNLKVPLNKQNKIIRRSVFTTSGTFVAPSNGTYLVTAIGCGGKGGTAASSGSGVYGYGGGGGSGGMACSALELTKGDSFAITVNTSLSSFGSLLTANTGADGSKGTSAQGASGTGGTASGGNLFNITGNSGNGMIGGNVPIATFDGRGGGIGNPNPGGNGFFPMENVTGSSSGGSPSGGAGIFGGGIAGTTISPGYTGGGGGGAFGGGGGGAYGSGGSYSTPGNGALGAVIIEYICPVFN